MKLQSNRFPKKQYLAIGKFFNLPYYRTWKNKKNHRKHRNRRLLGEPCDPKWRNRQMKKLPPLCVECKSTEHLTLDHKVPLHILRNQFKARQIENLQVLCLDCHTEKTRIENRKLSTCKSL
jgi:5-methylcytosine-specific restriction endonuclease McrA